MNMEESIRFYDWITSKRVMPTAEDVIAHFEVSRATAYRYLDEFRKARGIVQVIPPLETRYMPIALPARRNPIPAWLHSQAAHG